jgi:transmembrane sensor
VTAKDEHLRDLIAEQAADFFVAHRAGTLSDAQKQEFLRWLRTSPMHVAEYLAVSNLARDLDGAARTVDLPLEELVATANSGGEVIAFNTASAARAEETDTADRPNRARKYLRWGAIAAAYIALAGAGAFYYMRSHHDVEISAGHGELRTWQLADNTIVHLNSDSAISVKFDATRRVVDVEQGEVYFEVAKDPKRHFEVRVGSTVLQDIGTSFDVYRQAQATMVSVAEGQVAVHRGPELKRIADLRAGDQAEISPTRVIEKNAPQSVRQATAWLHQEIIFDHTPIDEAVQQFNRYIKTQVVVDNPRIGSIAISGVFHIYDLDSFAQFLNGLPDVEAVMKGNVLHIANNGRRQIQGG